MINVSKLAIELQAAGLLIHGVDINGVISWVDNPTQAQQEQAAAILAAHDPAEYTMQPEQQIIIANGLHAAHVTTRARYIDPLPTTDTLMINGLPQTIDLSDGGSYGAWAVVELTSNTPGTVFRLEYHGQYAIVRAE